MSAAASTLEEDIHKEQKASFDFKLIGLVARYARPHKRDFVIALGLVPVIMLIQLAQPWLVMKAIDGPIARHDFRGLAWLGALFALLIVADLALRLWQIWHMERLGQKVVCDVRTGLFEHLQKQNLGFFERSQVGKLVTRLTNDLEGLSELFSSGLFSLLQDIFTLAGILVTMFILNVRLTLVTFSVVPPLFLAAWWFRVRMRRSFLEIRHKIASLNGYMQENLTGIETVKLFAREGRNSREFERLNADHRDANYTNIWLDSSLFALVEFVSSLAVALFIWYGARQAIGGMVTFGVLVAFVEYIQRFFVPIRDISAKYTILQSGMTSAERIHELLETREFLPVPARPHSPAKVTGAIEFDNVVFGYKPGEPVLKGVSFRIEPGQSAAFVGQTGAGKSTLIKLLSRFYDPLSGSIRLDGHDLREFDPAELRRHIGQVLQDVFLFSGSVADNIALGLDLSREKVEEAARVAQADRFVSRLPQGYDSPMLERGTNLSFGERQLIAFARVLAKDPPILVLDEATSNIDTETEAMIQEGLRRVMAGRTSLIIAHRLSTITHVDRIHVLSHGEIVESGRHEELMAQRGAYWRLYQLQFQKDTAGA